MEEISFIKSERGGNLLKHGNYLYRNKQIKKKLVVIGNGHIACASHMLYDHLWPDQTIYDLYDQK